MVFHNKKKNGKEEVLRITPIPCITGTSPSDYLVSYSGDSLGGGLHLCKEILDVFYSPNRLGNTQS